MWTTSHAYYSTFSFTCIIVSRMAGGWNLSKAWNGGMDGWMKETEWREIVCVDSTSFNRRMDFSLPLPAYDDFVTPPNLLPLYGSIFRLLYLQQASQPRNRACNRSTYPWYIASEWAPSHFVGNGFSMQVCMFSGVRCCQPPLPSFEKFLIACIYRGVDDEGYKTGFMFIQLNFFFWIMMILLVMQLCILSCMFARVAHAKFQHSRSWIGSESEVAEKRFTRRRGTAW